MISDVRKCHGTCHEFTMSGRVLAYSRCCRYILNQRPRMGFDAEESRALKREELHCSSTKSLKCQWLQADQHLVTDEHLTTQLWIRYMRRVRSVLSSQSPDVLLPTGIRNPLSHVSVDSSMGRDTIPPSQRLTVGMQAIARGKRTKHRCGAWLSPATAPRRRSHNLSHPPQDAMQQAI